MAIPGWDHDRNHGWAIFGEQIADTRDYDDLPPLAGRFLLAGMSDDSAIPGNPAREIRLTAESESEVMFFDTDCGGVVSNIAYLRFFEVARTRLTDALGMTLAEMSASQVFPAVARTEVDYRKPAKLGDRLSIRARVERFEKVRMHCHFEMRRIGGDEAVIAECRQVCVLVQMPEGRPKRIPAEWLALMEE